jgi:hypothetical protein
MKPGRRNILKSNEMLRTPPNLTRPGDVPHQPYQRLLYMNFERGFIVGSDRHVGLAYKYYLAELMNSATEK